MKKFEKIESPKNAKFKVWQSLKTTKGLKKNQRILIAGKNLVSECHELFFDQPLEFLFTESMGQPANLGPQMKAYELSESLFKEIDPLGLNFPLLVAPLPEMKDLKSLKSDTQVLLPFGDPKNLGAALRNCLAFGMKDIVLLKEAAHPFHSASIKASSGAVFKLNFYEGPSIHDLKVTPDLFILDGQGQDLRKFKWPEQIRLLVGEEGPGVPEALKKNQNQILSIPINDVESLNAHQALGIALYDRILKRSKA